MQVTPQLLSMRDVCRVTTLSRTAINKLRKAEKFPVPVPLGDKRFAFLASDISEWIDARAKLRHKPAQQQKDAA